MKKTIIIINLLIGNSVLLIDYDFVKSYNLFCKHCFISGVEVKM